MIAAYDPLTYWRTRGQAFARQEMAFAVLVRSLSFDSVLDVGCGPGRLAALIRGLRPNVDYTGVDVSPDVLQLASLRVPGGRFHESTLADFLPGRTYDLVLASEVLMHVPPHALTGAVRSLARLSSRHVVTIDWTEVGAKGASHNFAHDYRPAFKAAGLRIAAEIPIGQQTIYGLAVCGS